MRRALSIDCLKQNVCHECYYRRINSNDVEIIGTYAKTAGRGISLAIYCHLTYQEAPDMSEIISISLNT